MISSGVPAGATTLKKETKSRIDRNDFAAALLDELERSIDALESPERDRLYRIWESNSMLIGRDVLVKSSGRSDKGRAVGIDADGALILQDAQRAKKKIFSGDVLLCR